jgi:hypothetical protein
MEKKPEYKISSSVNDEILEINLTGEMTKHSIDQVAVEAGVIISESGLKNILVDVRALKGRLGIMDTYAFVRSPAEKPKVKSALVDLTEHKEYLKFLETTARNAGISLKCFVDIDAARAWLKSSNLR